MKKILLIEDDHDLAKMVEIYLKREGFITKLCSNGREGLEETSKFQPDLLLLDLMVPEINGLEILRQVRVVSKLPVIIVSAKESETDRVLGLKLGADDYITKPFSIKELIARIEAIFRRIDYLNEKDTEQIIQYNDITIDTISRIVIKEQIPVNLTSKEFDLLVFFVEHPKQVLTKEQIYNHVWTFDSFGDINTVVVHIQKIREKLQTTNGITTIRGIGYRFDGELR
ncbi:DNA-binding response regulator [Enterococcus durans IPLA 655]|uniref:response regulator transcription factor n=1 Tax=Enterococcus durans TaxID=53345 RepID=UPI0003287731|nr:response regulator transcription factor [Enterococcus durans]EMS74323.1 DNA-binding response regulator [Enterococcus durans IPLA 655]